MSLLNITSWIVIGLVCLSSAQTIVALNRGDKRTIRLSLFGLAGCVVALYGVILWAWAIA